MRGINTVRAGVLGLLMFGAEAAADPVAVAPPTPAATAPPQDTLDKTVCRVMSPPIGSRLGAHRECRTQREWDVIQHEQQDRVTKMQTRGLTSGTIGH